MSNEKDGGHGASKPGEGGAERGREPPSDERERRETGNVEDCDAIDVDSAHDRAS